MSRNRTLLTWSLALASAVAFVVGASARQVVQAMSQPSGPLSLEPATEQDPGGGRGGQGRGGQGGQTQGPRPYDQVITSAARTDDGVFKVHRIGENMFYEIPKAQLDKDFLWNTQLKKTTINVGYGGQTVGSRVVRWTLKGDRVLLVSIDYTMVADPANPITSDANV
jgi:hypothetical protein